MDRNKEILSESKVQQLMNLKKFAQAQTFKKVLSNIFNVSLDNGDIHYIFERLNIPFSIMNVRDMSVKYYKRDAVIEVFYKGLLSREIESLTRNRKVANTQPKPQIPGYGKSVVVNTTNRHIPNDNNSMEDDYEYSNGENDMEKYSDYLINNVYERKRNMNKITINENDIKTLVIESVKNVLKEIAGKALQENNFKSPLHRKRAAIFAGGKRRNKTPEEIQQTLNDFNAKLTAIRDINNDRSIKQMSKHEQIFNNPINDETFDIDFDELGYYDPYYDDFNKNNKSVKDIAGSAVSSHRFPSYDEYLD
jgi:hypothetical protein